MCWHASHKAWVSHHGRRSCIALPLNDLDNDRRALGLTCFTFASDEFGLLNLGLEPAAFYRLGRTQDLEEITHLGLQSIIKACYGFEYWFFMPDTRFGLREVYPHEEDNPGKWISMLDVKSES